MKIFLSYKFTDIPIERLNETVVPLIAKLRDLGHIVFCNLERDPVYVAEKWTGKQIMDECFCELAKCERQITFVDTVIGEGMCIELGFAIARGLHTTLLLPEGMKSVSSKAVVDRTIVYKNMEHLFEIID